MRRAGYVLIPVVLVMTCCSTGSSESDSTGSGQASKKRGSRGRQHRPGDRRRDGRCVHVRIRNRRLRRRFAGGVDITGYPEATGCSYLSDLDLDSSPLGCGGRPSRRSHL